LTGLVIVKDYNSFHFFGVATIFDLVPEVTSVAGIQNPFTPFCTCNR
jgi:hypothetical protein